QIQKTRYRKPAAPVTTKAQGQPYWRPRYDTTGTAITPPMMLPLEKIAVHSPRSRFGIHSVIALIPHGALKLSPRPSAIGDAAGPIDVVAKAWQLPAIAQALGASPTGSFPPSRSITVPQKR